MASRASTLAGAKASTAPKDNRVRSYETNTLNGPFGIKVPLPTGRSYTTTSSGVRIGSPTKPGQAPNYPPGNFQDHSAQDAFAQWISDHQQINQPGSNPNPLGPSGGGGGGGGGRGGGAPAISAARAQELANQLFAFNADPYNQMHGAVTGQRDQANAYQPNFDAITADYQQRGATLDQQRAAAVTQRLSELAGFGGQLAQQTGQGLATGLRDLAGQGFNTNALQQQATQQTANQSAQLGAQGQYMSQLNASAANDQNDYARGLNLMGAGAKANLANNRGTLLNQLQQQDAQIALQQAQAQQQNEVAKRQFLLQYGVS